MKTCGFTIVRNAVKFNYPVIESIRSILPLVDRFYVSIGNSEDATRELIESISSDKIKILHSIWDDSLRKGGKVLADETNKVIDQIPADYEWLFYLQADEVIHENDLPEIQKGMEAYLTNPAVEGLLLHYNHFYGTYDYIGDSRTWYRYEVRIIRNDKRIRSFRDAQGFRKDGKKLHVKMLEASVYHYGWVKDPKIMAEKMNHFRKMYHSDDWVKKNYITPELFDFSEVDSVKRFESTHPEVMKERIARVEWKVNIDPGRKNFKLKDRFLYWVEKETGKRLFEYRNYTLI
ncbi:MAG: glycosyltransferase family 2 protein [Chlorobi bacterium]|nr:glycosyltransferase family 2 protein [Chlorobiota bacterium]